MKTIGWTLVAAAIAMHFCFCEWWSNFGPGDRNIFGFIYAKEALGKNTVGAGFWGVVIPVLIAGAGAAILIRYRVTDNCPNCGSGFAGRPTQCEKCGIRFKWTTTGEKICCEWLPPAKASTSPGDHRAPSTESAKLLPQAMYEKLLAAENVGRAPSTESAKLLPCPDCGRQISRLAASCPQCGRPLAPEKDERKAN
jgi:predicted RNA-binding Zn-ribbon protein involved in translation (DUF1610 family)